MSRWDYEGTTLLKYKKKIAENARRKTTTSSDSRNGRGLCPVPTTHCRVGWLFPPSDRAISPSVYFTRKTDPARSYWKTINSCYLQIRVYFAAGLNTKPRRRIRRWRWGSTLQPLYPRETRVPTDKDGSRYYGNSKSVHVKKRATVIWSRYFGTRFFQIRISYIFINWQLFYVRTLYGSLYGYKWQPYTATLTQGIP
jgi:hypothetical protein